MNEHVTGDGEGHGRPEGGPPGGLVEVLTRWEREGGRWRVVETRGDWIDIALLSGEGGQQVSRMTSARTSVLESFLDGRTEG